MSIRVNEQDESLNQGNFIFLNMTTILFEKFSTLPANFKLQFMKYYDAF